MVKMVLGSSDTQASSVATLADNYTAGFESLISAFDTLANEDKLSGDAYTNIKSYGSSVVTPLVKAFILLADAAKADVQKLPDEYRAQVGGEDLDEETLTAQISAYATTIEANQTSVDNLGKTDPMTDAVQSSINSLKDTITSDTAAKAELEEKLRKLREYDAQSSGFFSDIAALESAVTTGISQLQSGISSFTVQSGFPLPSKKDLAWTKKVNKSWEKRTFIMNYASIYGFNKETVLQILKVKKGIDKKFPDKSQEERDYLLNRVLGAPVYEGFNWNNTAGDLKDYFSKLHVGNGNNVYYTEMSLLEIYQELGLTKEEAEKLSYNIRLQNQVSGMESTQTADKLKEQDRSAYNKYKSKMEEIYGPLTDEEFRNRWDSYIGQTDFAHQSITTATHLNPDWELGQLMFGGREDLEEVSGWRGDATEDAEANPSMGNDDYKADLDAVNITKIMEEKNLSFMEASNYYYNNLEDTANPDTKQVTRAELFKQNVDLDHIKDEVYDLVPDSASGKVKYSFLRPGVTVYEEPTEEQKRKYLKKHYPDSYDFLRSLEEEDSNMGNYAEKEK
ncbi:T7SS effector LXG polymorphic toxin [Streptococcus ferus]|uniref:T7SS effector LXG polymorphic toxin n=1 Tax=Streptococcus ferus TaxID=1345 RepID=UPI00359FA94D